MPREGGVSPGVLRDGSCPALRRSDKGTGTGGGTGSAVGAAVAVSRAQRRGDLCFRQGGWRWRALGSERAELRQEDKGTFVGI